MIDTGPDTGPDPRSLGSQPEPDPGPVVLRALALHKSYATGGAARAVLRGVDLTVHAGEWVAVMGPSGGGKSTLLHLLGGLDRPDQGSVHLAGEELGTASEAGRAHLRRRHVGFVFQSFNLVPHLDVAGNVELPLQLIGVPRRQAQARRTELLVALGLADHATSYPATLSGGQQQRVALARAVAHRPAVLLADEPTGALDTESARGLLDLLRRQHAEGQAIVMVTHDHRVAAAADRVVLLRDGVVVDEQRLVGRDRGPQGSSLLATLPDLEIH